MSFIEPPPGEVRRCIKCGREIGPDQSMCAVCNRAGMATPSATQYHGTIVVAVIGAVAALAVGASLSLRGVGPYEAEVIRIAAADPGYDITVRVRNAGSREGRAHCQLVAISETGRRMQTRTTLTPPVAAGAAVTVTEHLAGVTERPEDVTVGCG